MIVIPFNQTSCRELAADAYFAYQMLVAAYEGQEITADREKAISKAFKVFCLINDSCEHND